MSSHTPTRRSLVTDSSLKLAARGLVLGALVSASVTAAVSSAGVAAASCTLGQGIDVGTQCALEETSFSAQLDGKSSVSAQGRLSGPGASSSKTDVTAGDPPVFEPRPASESLGTQYPAGDHVLVAESMVGTDVFGPYGCEDFVDAAFGLTTETGIGHDMALSFYQSLAARGLDHHQTPIPRGALVFSAGPYGNHVDISRGDGTFVSGGVQGLSPGYGDGHQVQILPTANLGAWTMYGWVYPPW
ncbi:MAG: hypothetical protein WCI74_07615 [Actinomycetes bacterium]